jgi:hypothetical protein
VADDEAGIDRNLLLQFRHVCLHVEDARQSDPYPRLLGKRKGLRAGLASKDPQSQRASGEEKPLKPKRREASTCHPKIHRTIRALLNKVCPENKAVILEHMSKIKVVQLEELRVVAREIFSKALEDVHYSETYAEVAFALSCRYPEFSSEQACEPPLNFKRILIRECQSAFENLPCALEDIGLGLSCEDAEDQQRILKKRALSNMVFVGHLLLLKMISSAVVRAIMQQCFWRGDDLRIECACALLKVVGPAMLDTEQGRSNLEKYLIRLTEMRANIGQMGAQSLSKRVGFVIQDIVDMHSNGWVPRQICEKATTKHQLRQSVA